ncbi:MAG: hypothetical protein MZU95_10640 [Desulfomicrobium escambiense]|nr:hypothetical protein [Desulfomicrobium escambiense]
MPQWSLVAELLAERAAAVALIGLVQAAGVSTQRAEPRTATIPNVSRDFAGQGLANLAASLFKGMPVGGADVGDRGARRRRGDARAGRRCIPG